MTPIERIREQTERVRVEHERENFDGEEYCHECGGPGWPCEIRRFAEDRLKLAEMLDLYADLARNLDDARSHDRDEADRVLAEVAGS
jgi:hypothetical protein